MADAKHGPGKKECANGGCLVQENMSWFRRVMYADVV